MKSIGARMWMFLVLGLAAAAFPAGVCGQPVDGGADNGRPGDKRSTDGTGVVFDRDFAPAEGWIKPQEAPYRAEICLNGRWDFQVAELPDDWRPDQGKAPNLGLPQDDAWDAVKIKIPSPWNVNSIMMDRTSQGMDSRTFPSYPQRWDRVRMGWLKKAVTVPAAWRDKRIYLHLEAVAGWCDIFINRRPVGSHFDTSLPAEVDVTPLVQCGQENEILLAVRDARLFSAKGTYGSFTYPTGSFWLADAVGVWQDVYLLARPSVHVSDVFVQSRLDRDELGLDVELVNRGADRQALELEISIHPWINGTDLSRGNMLTAPEIAWSLGPQVLQLSSETVELQPGRTRTVHLRTPVAGRLQPWEVWSRGEPHLYAALIEVRRDGRIIDRKYQRFGWRQVELKNGDFLLNGRPLKLMHDFWHFMGVQAMTRRYFWAWYTLAREAHVNFIRPHAMPHPPFVYDLADEMGMLIMDETGIFASHCNLNYDSEAFWQRSRDHVRALVLRDRNHPSIVGWSVANEVWCVLRSRAPAAYQEKIYDNIFELCTLAKSLDPTRQWVQSDGDRDLNGRLDVCTIHCGSKCDRDVPAQKLWGVTEGGSAYFGATSYYEPYVGDRAYRSFHDRMDALAIECYQLIRDLRRRDADICNTVNLFWHGIEPLPVGLRDRSKRRLDLSDGVFFEPYREGKPGMQPERIAPFSTCVNPGYDPVLPLYKPYPLYMAMKAAMDPRGPQPCRWDHLDTSGKGLEPPVPEILAAGAAFLGDAAGGIYENLQAIGVPFTPDAEDAGFLIIDVSTLRAEQIDHAKQLSRAVVARGGTVLLAGASPRSRDLANLLLPAPAEWIAHEASALVANLDDPRSACLSYKELYFAENYVSRRIAEYGLAGEFAARGIILLSTNNTDWRRWLNGPEYSKTISVFRSEWENEQLPVLVDYPEGGGHYVVSTLVTKDLSDAHAALYRKLLTGLGLALRDTAERLIEAFSGQALTQALSLGRFGAANLDEAMAKEFIPERSPIGRQTETAAGRTWILQANAGDRFILHELDQSGPTDVFACYFGYWLYCPVALDDLLDSGPDLPRLTLFCYVSDRAKVYLNQQELRPTRTEPVDYRTLQVYEGLPLRRGWNGFLIKVASDSFRRADPGTLAVRLVSDKAAFESQLKSAVELVGQ